jgi:hypothetical protein
LWFTIRTRQHGIPPLRVLSLANRNSPARSQGSSVHLEAGQPLDFSGYVGARLCWPWELEQRKMTNASDLRDFVYDREQVATEGLSAV